MDDNISSFTPSNLLMASITTLVILHLEYAIKTKENGNKALLELDSKIPIRMWIREHVYISDVISKWYGIANWKNTPIELNK